MNIIFVGGFTYPIGMAGTKRVSHLVNFLHSNHHIVGVIIIHNDNENIKKFGTKGEYYGIPFTTVGQKLEFNFKLPINIIKLIFEVSSYLRLNRSRSLKNILYIYNGINYENFIFILFGRLLKYKIVTDIVEDYSLHKEKVSLKSKIRIMSNLFFERRLSRYVNGIIVISQYLRKKLSKVSKNKVPILLVPACLLVPSSPLKKNNNKNGVVRFLYAGSYGNKDGLPLLVSAFNDVSIEYACELMLAGKYYNSIEYLKIDNNDKIKFYGFIPDEDFSKFLENADVLCMTRVGSDYANAGFPFKLVEYLSTGKPVISSDVSDVKSYLKDKYDIFLYEADNLNELKNTMKYVIINPSTAADIGMRGYESALKFFNVEIEGKKLINFLESL